LVIGNQLAANQQLLDCFRIAIETATGFAERIAQLMIVDQIADRRQREQFVLRSTQA